MPGPPRASSTGQREQAPYSGLPASTLLELSPGLSPQVIVYVEDVNDEAPVFTQQQYNRLGLRETAGIGTSVIVVRATDRDTGKAVRWAGVLCLRVTLQLPKGFCHPSGSGGAPWVLFTPSKCPGPRGLESGNLSNL